jgi:hypothetical protein
VDRPDYFEPIRSAANKRWEQLEADPDLAGPWHQLFEQVQSPRHVVSELLQNADDAGATEATVNLSDQKFVFSHNGQDFSAEDFQSLCRFGYSNKRSLHTVGFRGIGFKSTFSLGDEVRLATPTLSVAFRKKRFTEPVWWPDRSGADRRTVIEVRLTDGRRRADLVSNLDDWFTSPASLLFFHNIRSLRIGDRELRWVSQQQGPIPGSEWVCLASAEHQPFLLIRSDLERFPNDAVEELRAARRLDNGGLESFPPCRVEIIYGLPGRLFVVLPTGVTTKLPFACNAPFLQDPARLKIKDPSTSPTNRWLLERIGRLAGRAVLAWLQADNSLDERAPAYGLLPEPPSKDPSLEGTCGSLVAESAKSVVLPERFLLTQQGALVSQGQCVALPNEILHVWSAGEVESSLTGGRPALALAVADIDRKNLIRWGFCLEINKSSVLDSLMKDRLPRPAAWRQLLELWEYVSPEVTPYYHYGANYRELCIVPVQSKDVLHSSKDVVRLGERKLLESSEDWEFLANHLLVLNQNWLRFLQEQRQLAGERNDPDLGRKVSAAYKVLECLGLEQPADASLVLQKVAVAFFGRKQLNLDECVRLARISARLNVEVTDSFQFVTQDMYRRSSNSEILADEGGQLEEWLPSSWYSPHVLHTSYWEVHDSCAHDDWLRWVRSPRSRLLSFPPLRRLDTPQHGRAAIRAAAATRGLRGDLEFRYKTDQFVLEDWDFEDELWEHWRTLAQRQPRFWAQLLARLLCCSTYSWPVVLTARALHVATTGNTAPITSEPLTPRWIDRLRSLPCLEDTWGHCHEPAELLRRTPTTESLLDVEPFVRAELDTEANRPVLVALGVRETPTGPAQLIARLRSLAKAANPPVSEVLKWYRRLDQLIDRCSTQQAADIRTAFRDHGLTLTGDNAWVRSGEVFLRADQEDAPGAALVHPAATDLSLWSKVGVAEHPTADLAIEWLTGLNSRSTLSQDEARRVRALLPRYPERIWAECQHWMNIEGEWVPVEDLEHSLTMQALIPWKDLFQTIKCRTADLQKLPSALTCREPFSRLSSLATVLENRLAERPKSDRPAEPRPWLEAFGRMIGRISLESEEEARRVQIIGERLQVTRWQAVRRIETVPYINGEPAGTPRSVEVLWSGETLFVADGSPARTARSVPAELGRLFDRADLLEALKMCYERTPEFVIEYLEGNFSIVKDKAESDPVPKKATGSDASAPPPGGAQATEGQTGADEEAITAPGLGEELRQAPLAGDLVGPRDSSGLGSEESPTDVPELQPEAPRTPRHTTEPRIGVMERFVLANGYQETGTGRFQHADGTWIAKVSSEVFPWECRTAGGELLRSYLANDHCLEEKPLQLGAEVWNLCIKFPDTHALILVRPDGEPVEVPGRRLQEMLSGRRLVLHAAAYRLVYVPPPEEPDPARDEILAERGA